MNAVLISSLISCDVCHQRIRTEFAIEEHVLYGGF